MTDCTTPCVTPLIAKMTEMFTETLALSRQLVDKHFGGDDRAERHEYL